MKKDDFKGIIRDMGYAMLFGLASDIFNLIFQLIVPPFPFFCTITYPIFYVAFLIIWTPIYFIAELFNADGRDLGKFLMIFNIFLFGILLIFWAFGLL